MDIIIKTLLKTSLRNVNILPQYLAISRFYHVTRCKNYSLQSLPNTRTNEDQILKTMNKLQSPSRIITCIESNADYITSRHIVVALTTFQKCYSAKFNNNSTFHINDRNSFKMLCTVLKPQLEKLKLQDAIISLDCFYKLRVSNDNDVLQWIINYIMNSVDQLSIYDIVTLHSKIKILDGSSTTLSLLRNSFVNNLYTKVDKDNINELKLALMYTSKEVKDSHVTAHIIQLINNYEGLIPASTACSILISLCTSMHQPPGYLTVLQRIQEIIIQNTNGLSLNQLIMLVHAISTKVNEAHDEFYNEVLLDNITRQLISNDIPFNRACYVLRSLSKIRHVQIALLDYLSAKCFENPDMLKNSDASSILSLVTGLAFADYKPAFWDAIQKTILDSKVMNYDNVTLCYFALQLACLDCFDPNLLEKVFTAKYDFKDTSINVWWTLFRLYQSVKIFYPEYKGPWPSDRILSKLESLLTQGTSPLHPSLVHALGGSSYILNDVRTKYGQIIDHVVVMRKGGYPISINSDISETSESKKIIYLEDIPRPSESQIITILYMRPQWYAWNTKRLVSPYLHSIKTLEALSCNVIPINANTWNEMSSNERIPYIMRAIKLKCEDSSDN